MRPLAAGDPRVLGPYRALGVLGDGGMGRVLLATGPDGRPAAVKLVHDFLARDAVFRERFRREIAACRLVSGAYTAPVLDADPDAPTPWLATRYVPGPSLGLAVTSTGPFPAESLRLLAVGLATALADIHRAGLVHRDLKPANLLLAHDGPRVIDFGIARAAEDDTELTGTGAVIGSPEFMSPEQAHGRELTPATDVFSLGTVLVFAATGRGPFAGSSAAQSLYNVAHADPDLDGVPPPLRDVVAACLDKDPRRRPTPGDLLDRLTGDVRPGAEPWPPSVHELIREREADAARALLAPPPTADRSAATRRRAVRTGILAAVVVTAFAATLPFLVEPDTRAGHAAPGGGVPDALPAQPPPGESGSPTTSPAPADDGPLGLDRLRAVDPCAVLPSELTPQPAVHLERCTYEHADGRWFDLALGDRVPVNPTPDEDADPVDHTEIDGLSLVVDQGGEGRCETVAVLPGHADLGVSVTVGPGVGDVTAAPCASAHAVLSDALAVLRDGGPERENSTGSLATVDPCALLGPSDVSRLFGVSGTSRPERLYRCEWELTGTLVVELSRDVDPAALEDRWQERELAGRTVYTQPEPQAGSPSCAVSWAHREPDDGPSTQAEVIRLRYLATASGRPVDDVCADVVAAAETVLPKLPAP
ncbi:serine/threonine protein kinase [Saccharomonospora piscinae]|uniref:serine/threonine-protein kinase n=1 Tax=Saccharomonospora piscinae TaxID=687388 RepID=UPI001105F75D|nr:serine/threonine-protein kinase [Saccharomonospora piscinae]TLW91749.1 serine/threonine protein kinase [Saccharomonospora piscinae]